MKSWRCLLVLFACYGPCVAANSQHSRVFGVNCTQNTHRGFFSYFTSSAGQIFGPCICARVCVCVCGWIVIWHGIVGVDLLCEANISLKAHFLNHCFTIWSFASNALFKRSRVCVPFRRHNIIYGHFPQS